MNQGVLFMFKSVTLEMSLKPFKQTDDEYIRNVCEKVYEQWFPYLKNRKNISVMMWTSDGSEILDYTGDLEQSFEWCYYLGTANKQMVGELPPETCLHERKQYYIENPPVMTYRILKKIIATLKEEGKKRFPNAQIQVGETFDIGPEFAISDFKYNRHKESCRGSGCDSLGFVDPTTLLHEDDYPYAAFPDGITEGTPVGTLLGAQTNIFLKDMGFDYIWLSNGMGFSYEPWRPQGPIFDGEKFYPEKLKDTKEKVFLFWKLFREACPEYPIRTRGTNFSVGMDYATDGVPLHDIYTADFNITPPPNSPWAALNDDVGIEVLGHLTRNCNLPGQEYMFRYYIHDIWWMNSPWYDRYEGNPYDIYIPLSLSRINEEGKVHTPELFHILSVDNSKGDFPDLCAYETIPHFLKAEKDMPDTPGPLVLVYPMREYTTTHEEKMLREMYYGDVFLKTAINNGFPLTTVVSTDLFMKHSAEIYKSSVLVVPAAFKNEQVERLLKEYARLGIKIIVYGTREALEAVTYACEKVETTGTVEQILKALGKFGYYINFEKEDENSPLPTMTYHRCNNATMINVYSRDTTVETRIKFPLGAPVINGYDTKLVKGYATYRFPRSVHGECRVFVKQDEGIVRAREMAPANRKYRRKIKVTGLRDATVSFFAESYCAACTIAAKLQGNDDTPIPQKGWRIVNSAEHGVYLYGENVTGDITFCMPCAEYVD